jgi:hypothetical protein
MRRNRATILLAVVCLLALGACKSTTTAAGSGALNGTGASATPSGTHAAGTPTTATTKPAGTATPTHTATRAPDWPTPGDCVRYNPANLTVDGTAASGTFVVSSGSTVVMRLHGQDDSVAPQALALAQRYTEHCYIGRNNSRQDPGDYIFDYWRDPTGNTPSIPDPNDQLCRQYNNHNLTVEDMGDGNGWRVKDHDDVLHLFADQTDAENGDLVLAKYTQACSIGETESDDNDLGAVTYFQ